MKVHINNVAAEIAEGTTLGSLLKERGLEAPATAVAVNGKVVPRADRENFILPADAQIIIIKAACGG